MVLLKVKTIECKKACLEKMQGTQTSKSQKIFLGNETRLVMRLPTSWIGYIIQAKISNALAGNLWCIQNASYYIYKGVWKIQRQARVGPLFNFTHRQAEHVYTLSSLDSYSLNTFNI